MLLRAVFLSVLFLCGLCGPLRAEDCGLRGYDGGAEVLKLDCQDAATFATSPSPFQIRLSSGEIRGIKLVDPASANASKFRVRYYDTALGSDMIMAVGYILPGIASCEELQMIGFHPQYPVSGTYALGADIDCSATNPSSPNYAGSLWQLGYAARYPDGFDGIPANGDEGIAALSLADAKGWQPIGGFSGTLDGKSKVISNLYINRSGADYVGLFSVLSGFNLRIKDLGLANVDITGNSFVGALVGKDDSFFSVISNCFVTGRVAGGFQQIGGLFGVAQSSMTITKCHSSASVTGYLEVGGLVGISAATITQSYATGTVSIGDGLSGGGLLGRDWHSTVTHSYSTGTVTGRYRIGGVVGQSTGGNITNCYATGDVTGTSGSIGAGGLVGDSDGNFTNCYSTGNVTVGSGSSDVGGLIGAYISGTLTNNWWYNALSKGIGSSATNQVTGQYQKAGAASNFYLTGSPTGGAVYTGAPAWDFTTVWQSDPLSYPHLRD
ncbi:MAG: GLUG motif-containing protein [Candidatus Omnitrophica bacterium]|nr:GLUG motif-containing protein [Candidatus Omnitrophota bacterium]